MSESFKNMNFTLVFLESPPIQKRRYFSSPTTPTAPTQSPNCGEL